MLVNLLESDTSNEHVVISLLSDDSILTPSIKFKYRFLFLNVGGFFDLIAKFLNLIAIIKKERPTLIQTWLYQGNLIGGLAAKISGVSSVYWGVHHTDFGGSKTSNLTWLAFIFSLPLSYMVPKRIIFCSTSSLEMHVSRGYRKDFSVVIPNGHNTFLFKKNAPILV